MFLRCIATTVSRSTVGARISPMALPKSASQSAPGMGFAMSTLPIPNYGNIALAPALRQKISPMSPRRRTWRDHGRAIEHRLKLALHATGDVGRLLVGAEHIGRHEHDELGSR